MKAPDENVNVSLYDRPRSCGASEPPRHRCLTVSAVPIRAVALTVLAVLGLSAPVGLSALLPAVASAAFTRPFLRQITGAPGRQFSRPVGLAVDVEDNLWVSELTNQGPSAFPFDQFTSAENGNAFLQTLQLETTEPTVTAPESIAVNRSTGTFYVTGIGSKRGGKGEAAPTYVELFGAAGSFLKRFGPLNSGAEGAAVFVAVDNSAEPSSGDVYVSVPFENAIERFNASGEPVNFAGCGAECASYVTGNRITGTPSAKFFGAKAPNALAVDSHGDIFAVDSVHLERSEVDEFQPNGKFRRAFTGTGTPGLAGNHEEEGFGGELSGLAVDPRSDHLLVAVWNNHPASAIDEFDIGSGSFLNQLTETSAGELLHRVAGMTADSKGDLYGVDNTIEDVVGSGGVLKSSVVDAWGPGLFDPTVTLDEATARTPVSATLSGSVNPTAVVNPEHAGLSECEFQYVSQSQFDASGFAGVTPQEQAPCVPAAAAIPADEQAHPVHAEATGLASGTTYRYRLVAKTSGPTGGVAASAAFAFTAPGLPAIDSTSAANLSSTFADLRSQIDPRGTATNYRFEYLTQAAFQANGESFSGPQAALDAPIPDAAIGSGGATGSSPEAVLQHIAGLTPATVYRFRVVASNAIGLSVSPEASFTTLPETAAGLPDGRAYELLTPPDKEGGEDMFATQETEHNEFENRDPGYAAESGDRFLLQTKSAFGPFPASSEDAYVFSRTPSGWSYTSLASPSLGLQSVFLGPLATSDLARVAINDDIGSGASGAASESTLVGQPGGPYTQLQAGVAAVGEGTEPVGASRDLSRVLLQSADHSLAPGDASQDEGTPALYESTGAGECTVESFNCALVNVNSGGTLLNRCGAALGSGEAEGGAHNAVSADGSHVLFTAPNPRSVNKGAECWDGATTHTPQLYRRSEEATIELSAAQAGAPETTPHHPAVYTGAAADGSRVFFLSESELTTDEVGIHDLEFYEWRAEGVAGPGGSCPEAAGCLTRVSAGESGKAAAGVVNVPAISDDGSAVYFIANGVLASNVGADATHASLSSCTLQGASSATCNLYRYDTAAASTAYVAQVNQRDVFVENGPFAAGTPKPRLSWSSTPDGRYLLFASEAELTGYSTAEAAAEDCPNVAPNRSGRCREVYRYSYEPGAPSLGRLQCLSCNPSGAPPVSHAVFAFKAGSLKTPSAGQLRAISDNGSYAFFQTADPLVSQDNNGTQDVYEWEAGGTGSCRREAGCVSLISSGHDPFPSFFLEASPDGSNVFFGTHARLVPQDTDTAGDLYDARICTASDPCIKPPDTGTGQCEGDACQSPPSQPIDATPTSLTFLGIGNLASEIPTAVQPRVKPLTRAQLLSRALAACRRGPKKRRKACERQTHRRYGLRSKKASSKARRRP